MEYYEPPPNPLTLGLDGAALAILWGLLALLVAAPITYIAVRAIHARWCMSGSEAPRRRSPARIAISGVAALALVVVGGWFLLGSALNPTLAAADTGRTSDAGLQRDAIAVKTAVAERFPQIQDISGFRPDPFSEHDQGRALDILIPGDPTSEQGIALGDDIRDFLLQRANELGVQHVIWRQHLYRADGTAEPMQPRDSDVANHFTHLHVTTSGGGYP